MVMNSVKPGPEILAQRPTPCPAASRWRATRGVFQTPQHGPPVANSLILAVSITILNTMLSGLAAYAIAKIPFPGRDQLFAFMLSTMMIPSVLFLIPVYVLIIASVGSWRFQRSSSPLGFSIYNIFLLRQFIHGLPNELFEAAPIWTEPTTRESSSAWSCRWLGPHW